MSGVECVATYVYSLNVWCGMCCNICLTVMSCMLHYCFSWYSPAGQILHFFWILKQVKGPVQVTNSTKRSTSWEASSFSASQEILHILWNLKACAQQLVALPHPEQHDSSPCPPVPGLSSCLFLQCSALKLCFWFIFSCIHATCPSSHYPQFDHPSNIWWTVQNMKLLIM
jgi:hypothetical protein